MFGLALISLAGYNMSYAAIDDGKSTYAGDVPIFIEQAQHAGITHQYDGAWEYFVGGGLASFDCNRDRLPDVYIAGGANPAALYVNQSPIGGELRFTQLHSPRTDIKGVLGAYPIDIDNDGWLDLVVLRVGENKILKGGPDCQFTSANSSFGIDGGHAWTTSFTATFEKGAHYPTLAFGNYVDRSAPGSPWGTCDDNVLIRPIEVQRAEQSTNVKYQQSIALSPGFCALSMLFTDWNKSGVDALRITNDRHYYRGGEEQMWRLDSGVYPRLYARADGWQSLVIWGMGIAEGDLNADGYPEYVLTSMGDTKIQSLNVAQATEENRPNYEDIAYQRGATAHRPYTGSDLKPSTGWHAAFADVNNDSLLDLFISKGNVENMSDFASFDPDNLLLGLHDGTYRELGDVAGIALDRRGRGASLVDLNMDGLLDLIVVNRAAPVSVFRHSGVQSVESISTEMQMTNTTLQGVVENLLSSEPRPTGKKQPVKVSQNSGGKSGNWLAIELSQMGGNRNAIGARIAIKFGNTTLAKRVQIGGGHASGNAGFVHAGLGVAERATVRVQWPDGEWSAPYRVFANHFVVITRGVEHINYWYPGPASESH